jgi:A/G-specific adenine glycosylase
MEAVATPAANALLDWYDRHARRMPWRVPPAERRMGVLPDPYHVWLSEVMLQQTQVKTVHAYFLDFLAKWPDVKAMALAPADDVMRAWAGLGYYSRARNLKKCAEEVWFVHGGKFPESAAELRALPGIGAYTAAAIAAIAFDEPVAVVDGNVERVSARLARIEEPMPDGKETVRALVQDMVPRDRPGDFAQAMMDLGATICTPRNPACPLCPLNRHCLAQRAAMAGEYPRKRAKSQKPQRKGAAYVLRNGAGDVLLQKRPETGLLGGMAGVPTTNWTVRADGAISSWNSKCGRWTAMRAWRMAGGFRLKNFRAKPCRAS